MVVSSVQISLGIEGGGNLFEFIRTFARRSVMLLCACVKKNIYLNL